MSRVRLGNSESHNHLTVPEFSSGAASGSASSAASAVASGSSTGPAGANINLAITRTTTTTILQLPAGPSLPMPPLMPVQFFPNSHPFKMNHPSQYYADSTLGEKPAASAEHRASLVSSSQHHHHHHLDGHHRHLNGSSAASGAISSSSSSRAPVSTTSHHELREFDPTNPRDVAEVGGRVRNKSRQPKYRSTKRPPSERKFKCDHCDSK